MTSDGQAEEQRQGRHAMLLFAVGYRLPQLSHLKTSVIVCRTCLLQFQHLPVLKTRKNIVTTAHSLRPGYCVAVWSNAAPVFVRQVWYRKLHLRTCTSCRAHSPTAVPDSNTPRLLVVFWYYFLFAFHPFYPNIFWSFPLVWFSAHLRSWVTRAKGDARD